LRPSFRAGWRAAPAIALLTAATAGIVAVLYVDWPGHFPPDALAELAQGRSGVFNLWHPPVTAWLLGLAVRITPDAGAIVALDAVLFFGSLTAMAFVGRPGWLSVLALAAIAASPLALIYQGLVVKDVLFADASLAAFAALAWAARLWDRPAPRAVLVIAALSLLVLAALARQNGAVVAAAGCLTLAAIAAARSRRQGRRRSFWTALATSTVAIVATVTMADLAFVERSDGQPEEARQWMALQVYDLAGELRRGPALRLDVLSRQAPDLDRFVRERAAPAYDVTRADPILTLPSWTQASRRPGPWIDAQWRATALSHLGLWLRTRWDSFWQALATPNVKACAAVLVGVDPGSPKLLTAAGLKARDTDQDDWDGDYASAFLGTPEFSHLAWGALAIGLLLWALRDARRRPELIATIGLLSAALAFALSFFPISLACDYRYLYLLDAAAMAALIQRLALLRRR
jgi:hypothetical protein